MSTRRKFSNKFKLKICQEIDSGIKSRSEIIREHNIIDSVVAKWLSRFRKEGINAFASNSGEIANLKKRVTELEKILGRKTLEVEVLNEALKLADLKKGGYTR